MALEGVDGPIGYGRKKNKTWWCRESLRRYPLRHPYCMHPKCIAEDPKYDTAEKRLAVCGCECHR